MTKTPYNLNFGGIKSKPSRTPYNLNLAGMNNYIGSQEHFEDQINAHYDSVEERSKQQKREIEQQINKQIQPMKKIFVI